MSDYHTFTSTRLTEPDKASLLAQLRQGDATIGVRHDVGTQIYALKRETTWSAGAITAAQNVIDSAPAASARLTAKTAIDTWPIEFRALVLTLIDEINVLRASLPVPLVPRTPSQALAAVVTKALTL